MQTGYYRSPIGILQIDTDTKNVTGIRIVERASPKAPDSALLVRLKEELEEYFYGRLKEFSIPLHPAGTQFQKKVWDVLRTVPYGATCSYGELAGKAGNEKACRAVGMANHQNPILILIPCHRVIGANGSLTGYAAGIENKKYLLELERAHR